MLRESDVARWEPVTPTVVYEQRRETHTRAAEAAALIERARQGDQAAYGELVRDHQEIAFRVAFLITRSAPDAEDVTQEAFIKAWRALGRFRTDAPFRPWLLRIVANEAQEPGALEPPPPGGA